MRQRRFKIVVAYSFLDLIQTFAMGAPRVELDDALALAADIDDEEILRKIALSE